MAQYIVSARKYRPSTFASVVGQKALATTLKNAVKTQRLAHSYLFCGPRGVGKTSCARIFAKTINCEHPTADGEACNECASCRAFNEGTSMNIMELDAASNNGVDAMRDLVDMTRNPPSMGRYRVFIIDEVHMLSSAAFNAFLKTLEEPPSYVIFILATTEKQKIIPTILSRCQIYDFSRITIQDMIDHLSYVAAQEGMTAETTALNVIARQADGAMRDALSIFDQVAARSMGNITYASTIESLNVLDNSYYSRLLEAFLSGDVLKSWEIYKEIRDKGFDSHFFINGLSSYFRDLMVAQSPETLYMIEAGDDVRQQLAAEAAKCSPQMIYRAMSLLNDADLNYRTAANKQFLTELTLAKICQLSSPSPSEDSQGEGQQLRPIAVSNATTPAPADTPHHAPITQTNEPVGTYRGTSAPPPVGSRPVATAPTPTPTPPPKGADMPWHVPTSSPRPTSILGGIGVPRINRQPTTQQPQAAPTQNGTSNRTATYDETALIAAWDKYMAEHPTETILVHTMRACRPQRAEGDRWTVSVENAAQLDKLTLALPSLIPSLRNALNNDNVTIDVSVNEGEPSPEAWNEREILDHMVENIPDMRNFISEFRLTVR